MRHALHLPPHEARIQVAWPAALAAALKTPGLGPALVCCHELRPRMAAYETQLQALPRRVRRALRRQLGLPLPTLALWLALEQSPVLAATIEVGGPCTPVDAIVAANTDTATGGCPAGRGADTIVLPAGSTQMLTSVHNDAYGPTGLPVVSSVITLAGQGSTIMRDPGAPEFRLLAVHRTGDLTLQEATVRGGIALGPGSYDDPAGRGGGIWNDGTLTVTHSIIAGNSANSGGGVWNDGMLSVLNSTISGNSAGLSGGVANHGTLTVMHSTISGNSAGEAGGVANHGTLTITYSTITGNVLTSYVGDTGGGVTNYGTLTVTHSTIAENSAYYGGGMANFGTCTVTHSTITGNAAIDVGGGIDNGKTLTIAHSTIAGNLAHFSGGGGVWNRNTGTLTVTHSTIAANTASGRYNDGSGGGVHNRGTLTVTNSTIAANMASGRYGGSGGGVDNDGTLTVTHSTITGNAADYGGGVTNGSPYGGGTLIIARALISGNTAPTGPEIYHAGDGTVVADDHNLFGVDGNAGVVGFRPGPTDVVPPAGVRLPDILDPMLALHGGWTPTHVLVPGSPAIDAGGPVCVDADGDPLPTDQRGRLRPVDGDGDGTAACDIGSFEFFPLGNDLVTLDPDLETGFDLTPVPGGPAGTFTITATFTHTSETPLRSLFFEVTALSGRNLLLNADEGPGGVGATLTPEVGDDVLSPGETVIVDFVIGLQEQVPFTFTVELFGEPLR